MSIKKKIGTAMLSLALCISGTQLPTIVKSTTSTAVITASGRLFLDNSVIPYPVGGILVFLWKA